MREEKRLPLHFSRKERLEPVFAKCVFCSQLRPCCSFSNQYTMEEGISAAYACFECWHKYLKGDWG